jgi:hypothetical protein
MLIYTCPFGNKNAIHNAITNGSIAAHGMMPQNAILFCAQAFNGFLRIEIEIIGTQTDHLATQGIKGMRKQQ